MLILSGAIANSGCWMMLSGMTLAAWSGGRTTDCSPAVDAAQTLTQVGSAQSPNVCSVCPTAVCRLNLCLENEALLHPFYCSV